MTNEDIDYKVGRLKTRIRMIKKLEESYDSLSEKELRKLDRSRDIVNQLEDEAEEEGWIDRFVDACDY